MSRESNGIDAADPPRPLLEARELTIAVGGRVLVQRLSLQLRAGEFLAVLGRNGCGKSLTLHALAGLGAAAGGTVWLGPHAMRSLKRRQVARWLGLLPQDREEALSFTALESALIGRHPHLRLWQREGPLDLQVARQALAHLRLEQCANRLLATLSGGEQRRAAMAALLAQQPRVYLLDEPTNHLDPHHQIEVLELFRTQCAAGAAVIATLHDPTLAERYADRALLLHGDGCWRLGGTAEVLTAAELSALYLTPISEVAANGRRAFIAA